MLGFHFTGGVSSLQHIDDFPFENSSSWFSSESSLLRGCGGLGWCVLLNHDFLNFSCAFNPHLFSFSTKETLLTS